jgi:hypothetical protein
MEFLTFIPQFSNAYHVIPFLYEDAPKSAHAGKLSFVEPAASVPVRATCARRRALCAASHRIGIRFIAYIVETLHVTEPLACAG